MTSTHHMASCSIRHCLRILAGVVVTLVYTDSANCAGLPSISNLAADLTFSCGIYREEEGFLLNMPSRDNPQKSISAEDSTAELPSTEGTAISSVQRSTKSASTINYNAKASVGYALAISDANKFIIRAGYAYAAEHIGYDLLKNIKKKIKAHAYPYALLQWERKGILFMQNMSMDLGLLITDERKMGKREFPIVRAVAGLKYRMGDLTNIYAGLQIETYPKMMLGDEQSIHNSLSLVIGTELSL